MISCRDFRAKGFVARTSERGRIFFSVRSAGSERGSVRSSGRRRTCYRLGSITNQVFLSHPVCFPFRHRGAALATRHDASGRCIQLIQGLAAILPAGVKRMSALFGALSP